MTTNVCDVSVGMLTSDSRWSRETGEWIIYVDDTGYDKIVFDAKLAFLFAGDMVNIDAWKQWVVNGRTGPMPLSYLQRMSVIQVDINTGKVIFQSHQFLNSSFGVSVKALYAGTGAPSAKKCWDTNKCAATAVESAKLDDMLSGGTVVYLNRKTKGTNVTNGKSASDVIQQAKEKGMIMHKTSGQAPVPVKVAANDVSNPAAQAVANLVLSGGVSFSAPFPEIDAPWSEEKVKEFEAALRAYAD